MSDFDPCECVWNHEHAMRRLINMLRNTQDTCTDNECFTSPLGPQGNDPALDGTNQMFMMIMMTWLIIAAALFLFRPQSMRRQADGKDRRGPSQGDQSGGNPPSLPPVS